MKAIWNDEVIAESNVIVAEAENPDAAWYYANPKDEAKEIAGRVAFGNGVQIVE